MLEWGTRMLLKRYPDQGMTKAELSRPFGVSRRTTEQIVQGQEVDPGPLFQRADRRPIDK